MEGGGVREEEGWGGKTELHEQKDVEEVKCRAGGVSQVTLLAPNQKNVLALP